MLSLDFFPPCFLGFPELVRNLEKQGEVLYLHFSLPASHWLTSNVQQFGRYKNIGLFVQHRSCSLEALGGLGLSRFLNMGYYL